MPPYIDETAYPHSTRNFVPIVTQEEASIEIGPIKAEVDEDDSWSTVAMLMVLIIGTYFCVRWINRFFGGRHE